MAAAVNAESEPQRPPAVRFATAVVRFLLAQWLIIGFGFACVLAYFFPRTLHPPLRLLHWPRTPSLTRDDLSDVAAHGGTIRSEYSILYGAVAFIFLVSGLQLSPAKLKQSLTSWRLHVLVQGISFLVFPTVVLGIYASLPLTSPLCLAPRCMKRFTNNSLQQYSIFASPPAPSAPAPPPSPSSSACSPPRACPPPLPPTWS